MLTVVRKAALRWATVFCVTLAFTAPINAQESSSPEFIQAEIAQLADEISQLEVDTERLQARAARLEARADRTRNPRRAARLRNRANALDNQATNLLSEILALQNRIAELELLLAQGPDPEPVPEPSPEPQPEPIVIEGITVADLFLSTAAQSILDANPNAESAINDRLLFTATNAQPTNTVLSQPNADLRWRNNGDGNMVRLRPNSEQQFFFEQVRSADEHIGITLQSFSFFLVRGNVTFADFNAVRDEFLPIVRNAVNALVDNVNAASLGLPPLNPTTR